MLDIRNATLQDLDQIASLEAACFPEKEAADKDTLYHRLMMYPNHFWLLERDGQLVAMVDGPVVDEDKLTDEMYADPSFHDESGPYQMIFGLMTRPDMRKKGYASILLKEVLKDCREDSRKAVILTCKEERIPYYENLGFTNEGLSDSVHGDEKWYQMRHDLNE